MHFSTLLFPTLLLSLLSLSNASPSSTGLHHDNIPGEIVWRGVRELVVRGVHHHPKRNGRKFGRTQRNLAARQVQGSIGAAAAQLQNAVDKTVVAISEGVTGANDAIVNALQLSSQPSSSVNSSISNSMTSTPSSSSTSASSPPSSSSSADVVVKLPAIQAISSSSSSSDLTTRQAATSATAPPISTPAASSKSTSSSTSSSGSQSGSSNSGSGIGLSITTHLGSTSVGAPLDTIHSGPGTYYATGLGACGIVNVDTDYIVAVSYLLFDSFPGAGVNPNHNPICGSKLKVQYGGKEIMVTIQDKCMGCEDVFALDFSPSAFSELAAFSVGRIQGVQWVFM